MGVEVRLGTLAVGVDADGIDLRDPTPAIRASPRTP